MKISKNSLLHGDVIIALPKLSQLWEIISFHSWLLNILPKRIQKHCQLWHHGLRTARGKKAIRQKEAGAQRRESSVDRHFVLQLWLDLFATDFNPVSMGKFGPAALNFFCYFLCFGTPCIAMTWLLCNRVQWQIFKWCCWAWNQVQSGKGGMLTSK